jgi:hypothetical protein
MRCFNGIFCSLGFLHDFSYVVFLIWQGSFLGFGVFSAASQTRLFWYFSRLNFVEFCCGCSAYFWVLRCSKKARECGLFCVVGSEFLRHDWAGRVLIFGCVGLGVNVSYA